jgi:hypothetical protein
VSADEASGADARHAHGVQIGAGNTQINYFLPAAVSAEWPILVGRPPLPADAFRVRPSLRSAIEDAARRGGCGAVAHVLVGDGGTGKTQLTAEIFARARSQGVDFALWVSAVSRAAVVVSYAKAYTATHPGSGGGDAERDADAFLTWLAGTNRTWIVVLDDVADPADLSRLWPVGREGRVVVTTRRRDASIVARGLVVDVGVFAPEESAAYLTAKLSAPHARHDVLDQVSDLAGDLGHLPLALAQAAGVIVDEGLTCGQYRLALADRTRTLKDLFPTDPCASGDEYDQTLASSWSLAAERADALPPAGLARRVLSLAAMLDANGIPEQIFSSSSVRAFIVGSLSASDLTAGPVVSAPEIRRALRNLHRLSLISHDPADPLRSVRMHALAQRSAIEALDPDARPDVVRVVADALVEIWPEVERDRTLADVLRSNSTALINRDTTALWGTTAHPLLFRVGRSLGEAGLVTDAVAYFDLFQGDCRRRLGTDHLATLISRRELSSWQGESGDAHGASRSLDRLVDDFRGRLGSHHPETLTTRMAQVVWQGEAGDFAGAAENGEHVVTDLTDVLGPDDLQTLDARALVAFWTGHAGDPGAALRITSELLPDYFRVLAPGHPRILSTRHNLAHRQGAAGNPAAAVTSTAELLIDDVRVLGPDHFDTLDTHRNLAYWQGQVGDLSGAATALEDVARDCLRVLGPEHPHTMHARNDLANCVGKLGNTTEAVAALRQVLADRTRILGPCHPHTLVTSHDLANWRGHLEGAATAVAALDELVTVHRRVLGPNHPYTLKCATSLAAWIS